MEKIDIKGICEVLEGKVRGKPVAISMFKEEIPEAYTGIKVDPCQILRHAMDDDKVVFFSREYQDCLHGAYITGVHEGNEQMRTGSILTDYIPAYNIDAAYKVNSGQAILPQGSVVGMGAAPLDKVPKGVEFGWICLVCTPAWAAQIAAARAVEDGVQPGAAAGGSFCTDLFVTPWYEENVVITPGDMGGRMNNKLRAEELFVIIPVRWVNNLVKILKDTPDVKGIFEATRPEDSEYWARKKRKEEKAAQVSTDNGAAAKLAAKNKLKISMAWDLDAIEQIAKAPRFVRGFAVGNVEDFAEDKGYERITVEVLKEQMADAGVSKYFKFMK